MGNADQSNHGLAKSLYVVLGMHRSGTSAVTRGLRVLGVDLGSQLMPPAGDNEKGFFEDADINALNVELLQTIGQSWHTLSPIESDALTADSLGKLKDKATKLLQDRLRETDAYGIKDPRIARLLPFWIPVFNALEVDVKYVIVVRNPLSVAESLENRNGLPPEKSHYLWLEHLIPSLTFTQGEPRVVIDYDRLLDDPEHELERLAARFGIAWPCDKQELEVYRNAFLEVGLRHARHVEEEVDTDPATTELERKALHLLESLARDDVSIEDTAVTDAFISLGRQLSVASPALHYIDLLDRMILERDGKLAEVNRVVAEKNRHIGNLDLAIRERDGQIGELDETIAGKDRHLGELDHRIREQDGRISELDHMVRERENRISELGHETRERDERITELGQAIDDRDKLIEGRESEVADMKQLAAEQENQIADLSDVVSARDDEIHAMTEAARRLAQEISDSHLRLEFIEQSLVWRLAKPISWLWRFIGRTILRRGFRFRLVANGHLKPAGTDGRTWESIGIDPHFQMLPLDKCFPSGWVLLRTHSVRQGSDLTIKLYWDAGEGICENTCVAVPVSMRGNVEAILKLPRKVRALRWDPMACPGNLYQAPIRISQVGTAERVFRMFVRVMSLYRKLDESTRKQAGLNGKRILTDLQGAYVAAGNWVRPPQTTGGSYEHWIAHNDTLGNKDRVRMRAHMDTLPHKPFISVLMPTYNTPPEYLREAIDSVYNQIYGNWELCIADDASTKSHVKEILEEYRTRDSRIKVCYRENNGHISAASNSALELATGEYIALLDHDDKLAEHALYQAAACLNEKPDTQVIYSDEDKIDESGRRYDPHFKADWNPDLLLSQNYVSHLGVYKADLVKQVGGFRLGFEGSQDYDLLLRCVAHCRDDDIVHIPKVLYHWRASNGSTARSADTKSYTTAAGIRALQDYLASKGWDASVVQGATANTYRVQHAIPSPEPLVSLLIPTRDQLKLTRACVESIQEKTDYGSYEIIILDNQSVEPTTLKWFEEVNDGERVRVLRYDHPFNFSAINNFGVEHARGEIVGLINNDIEVISEDWLTEMVSHAVRPGIGCVGAKLYYDNETVQHAGVILGVGGVAGHSHKYFPRKAGGYFRRLQLIQNLSAVTGACLLVRKSIYQEVGGLNENDLKVAFNDVDFCLRVREAGYRNLWTPYAELYHHESISRGAEDTPEKQARFAEEIGYMRTKWTDVLDRDPAYNENLTLQREDFSIG